MSNIKVQVRGNIVKRFKPSTMKMEDFSFDPQLFIPMKTNTKIDDLLSLYKGEFQVPKVK